jgi:small subunit ribosomal protein S17
MATKKKDETAEAKSVEEQNAVETGEAAATEENAATDEAQSGADTETAADAATETNEATEEKPKKSKKANSENGGASIVSAVVGAVASAAETVAGAVSNLVGGGSDDKKSETGRGNRAERVGLVTSDKMTKTVVVRVDRLVKHPKYRKYVRRKKQFMAHDELGATVGDKVRIVETRPLSARKRWRVVEIVQKAAK